MLGRRGEVKVSLHQKYKLQDRKKRGAEDQRWRRDKEKGFRKGWVSAKGTRGYPAEAKGSRGAQASVARWGNGVGMAIF